MSEIIFHGKNPVSFHQSYVIPEDQYLICFSLQQNPHFKSKTNYTGYLKYDFLNLTKTVINVIKTQRAFTFIFFADYRKKHTYFLLQI